MKLKKFSKYFYIIMPNYEKVPEKSIKGKTNHKRQDLPQKELPHELSIILFQLESRIYNKDILIEVMTPLVCENLLCGATSPYMVTGCLRKFIKWVNNSRQRV